MRQFYLVLKTLVITLICGAFFSNAQAHEIVPAIVDIQILESQTVNITIDTNVEALIAQIGSEHADTDDAPQAQMYEELRALAPSDLASEFLEFAPQLISGITVMADEVPITIDFVDVNVPEVGDVGLARSSVVHLQATFPPQAEFFTWHLDTRFGASILRLNTVSGEDAYSAYLIEGITSDKIAISGAQDRKIAAIIFDYIVIGFTHIVPKGLDHILFVVGIFLASTKIRPLLFQISAFTVAHTISLALGILGLVVLDPRIVEPLIALSIAYVCLENIFFKRMTKWRPFIVFGFGLLHGLGFAGVLNKIGLPTSEFVTGLISFNVGVEFGQLSVISVCFLTVGFWFGSKHFYRRLVVIPASAVVGAIGIFWFIERVMFM